MILLVSVLVLVLMLRVGPQLAYATFDPELARLSGVRVAAQWERGVVLRLGKFLKTRGPGILFIIPFIDNVFEERRTGGGRRRAHSPPGHDRLNKTA